MAMQGNELERQRGDTRYQTTSQTEMQHQVVMEKEIKEPECESIQKKMVESPWRQTTGHLHQQPKFKRIYRGRETTYVISDMESEELLKHGRRKGYYLRRGRE